jgi:hypothetical protein
VVTGLLGMSVSVFAASASAAPPANDSQAGAVAVTKPLPFTYSQDTSEATVDAGEDVARDLCLAYGAPAFEKAVWFRSDVAPGATQSVLVDVTGSTYGAGIAVLQDTGSGLVALDCVPGFYLSPGAPPEGTYYVVIFGDGTTPETGGTLNLVVDEAPPPPTIDVTINKTGVADKYGGATISGTVTCTGDDAVLFAVEGQVTQTVGRLIISSYFYTDVSVACDGTPIAWTGYAPPTNGKFAGGKAVTVAFSYGCGLYQCSTGYAEAIVKLNRASARR